MDWAAATQKKLTPIANPRARTLLIHFLPQFVRKGRLSQTSRSAKTNSKWQINVAHHAGIVHESAPFAMRNFFSQTWQANIGTVALNQSLFSILGGRNGISGATVTPSSAGQRALAKIHKATRFTKGIKNAIVHHLLSPTRPKIFDIGMALSTQQLCRGLSSATDQMAACRNPRAFCQSSQCQAPTRFRTSNQQREWQRAPSDF